MDQGTGSPSQSDNGAVPCHLHLSGGVRGTRRASHGIFIHACSLGSAERQGSAACSQFCPGLPGLQPRADWSIGAVPAQSHRLLLTKAGGRAGGTLLRGTLQLTGRTMNSDALPQMDCAIQNATEPRKGREKLPSFCPFIVDSSKTGGIHKRRHCQTQPSPATFVRTSWKRRTSKCVVKETKQVQVFQAPQSPGDF